MYRILTKRISIQVPHDGMKLYMKAVEAKEKDEDQLKLSQSNSKAVVTCMKDLTEKFGWSVITINIDNPKYPGTNLVNLHVHELIGIRARKETSLPVLGTG